MHRACVAFVAAWMVACGGSEVAQDNGGNYGARPGETKETKVSLSVVEAESTALAQMLSMGRLTAEQARAVHVGTLPVRDLQGAVRFYLVSFASDPAIVTPWSYAGEHFALLTDGNAGSMVLVGATNEQPEVEMFVESLSLLADMHTTLNALGGEARLDSVLAPAAGLFLLRDVDGGYWDVSTQLAADTAQVEAMGAEYARVIAADEDGEIAAARESFASRLQDVPAFDFDTISRNGHLDPALAIDVAGILAHEVRAETLSPAELEQRSAFEQTEENCKRNIWGKRRCDQVEEGEMDNPDVHQGHYPRQPRGFTAPHCINLGRAPDTNAYLGCGPAAVVSWVWMAWKNGVQFPALVGLDRRNPEHYLTRGSQAYEDFSRRIGQDLMSRMGTCSFGDNGSLTMPDDFFDGANSWLASQGVSSRMHIIRHGNRDEKAAAVHNIMGVNNRAMIAGFDLGFASSHWSPIARYRVVREPGLFSGGPKVYIKSLDYQDRWYGLFGIKLLKSLAWIDAPPANNGNPGDAAEASDLVEGPAQSR